MIINLHYGPPCSHCSFHCNVSTWCFLEDFLVFWADTLLSPDGLLCLSHPLFLYNLTMHLHSSDFPSRYKFKLSCLNKHLLISVFNEIFFLHLPFFFACLHSSQYIYVFMALIYVLFYFLFFIFLLFHVSNWPCVCQIKPHYFKINITNTEITRLFVCFPEWLVSHAAINPVANSLEIWSCFSYCVPFCSVCFLNVLYISLLSLNGKKKTPSWFSKITVLVNEFN